MGVNFIFAVVEVAGDSRREPRYVRRPFRKEPDFHVHSANYDLKELLERSSPPA